MLRTSKPKGDKYTDGDDIYLQVLPTGKYWRMDYRYLGKRKTMALGVYPAISCKSAPQAYRYPR
ncbi:Arm DNA-binding domain-containing protein [Duganella sp. SG902]|uniref:Arm DNA-binding domain-containing protein n=1 Tax=Duganella sp. SG902 TaxID=2587016 RepID=UPI0035A6CFF0